MSIGWPFIVLFSLSSMALPLRPLELSLGEFSGRVSKMDSKAGLLRVRVGFENLGYLLIGNYMNFKADRSSKRNCRAKLMGKTNDYLLIKVFSFEQCAWRVKFTVGSLLYFSSKDLMDNIEKGKELLSILLKKRMALKGMRKNIKDELKSYEGKADLINDRYDILKEKLEREREKALAVLERKKSTVRDSLKGLEDKANDVDYKLEKYRIFDQSLDVDRWSLDHRLYFVK